MLLDFAPMLNFSICFSSNKHNYSITNKIMQNIQKYSNIIAELGNCEVTSRSSSRATSPNSDAKSFCKREAAVKGI